MAQLKAHAAALALSVRVLLVRRWPGTEHYRPPQPPPVYGERLSEGVGLVVFAAAAKGAMPERFGLAAWLKVLGRSVLDGGVAYPDDLRDDEIARIQEALDEYPLNSVSGVGWRLDALSAFCDPFSGTLYGVTYQGAGFFIGADLGRTGGLLGEHHVPRHGIGEGSFEVWPPGVGRRHSRGRMKRRSPHRPPLWFTARRVGWRFQFAPLAAPFGKRVGNTSWRGAGIDVLSDAYALDTDRSASFGEHRAHLGLPHAELPVTVDIDERGADAVTCAVVAVHELAVAVDARIALWFTTPQDRAEERGRVDLCKTASPGTLATQLVLRAGVVPPLVQLGLLDDEAER
jgi:hypothetical protein